MAALLSERGADVALLDHRPDRAALLAREGVRVSFQGRELHRQIPVAAAAGELGPADLAIVLVKAYATEDAAAHAAPCLTPHCAILTLQNGLGNYEAIAAHVPREQVLAGTIVTGCATEGPGRVRISGVGPIVLGSPFGNPELAARIAQLLGCYWEGVTHEPGVEAALWRKVVVNSAVNPLTALTGLPNGALLTEAGLRRTVGLIAREVTAVAAALGLELYPGDPAGPVAAVEAVCRLTGGNLSSMLQDLAAGRRTEVDQICGEVVRRAEALGQAAPLCLAMAALVSAAEKRETRGGRGTGPSGLSRAEAAPLDHK